MSDKIYIGRRLVDLDIGEGASPISRVTVVVDSENAYTAGDDTGRAIEVQCPWGTQAMAESILSTMSAVPYKPYSGSDSLLDPAAELGDGITAGGVYSVLASSDTTLDAMCLSGVSAPATDEIDDEYPYKTKTQRSIDRKIAATRSLITKTADEIRLEVQGLDNKYTALSVTLDGVTITDDTGTTLIKGSSIETDSLYVNAANITGTLTIGQLPSTVAETSDIPTSLSSLVNDTGYVTRTGVTTIVNGVVTTDFVNALGIRAIELQGNEISLYNYYDVEVGHIGLGLTTDTGVEFASEGNLQVTSDECFLLLAGRSAIISCDKLYPIGTAAYLGHPEGGLWQAVYAYTDTILTSDKNFKHDIESLDDRYLSMLNRIEPKRFKMNNGTSGRYHIGFIAQEVEDAMAQAGITDLEFAGWCKDKDADGNDVYFLRYGEFIGLLLAKIKELDARITEMGG